LNFELLNRRVARSEAIERLEQLERLERQPADAQLIGIRD
jgi:hypothetical protein